VSSVCEYRGPSWSWTYASWIYNYLCHRCISPLKLWVRIPPMAGTSWSGWYGKRIYNYLCNQCLSPLTLWVQITPRRGVLDTAPCDEVCQWLVVDRWFSLGTLVSSTKKTDCHDIAEISLKVALNTIVPNPIITIHMSVLWYTLTRIWVSIIKWKKDRSHRTIPKYKRKL